MKSVFAVGVLATLAAVAAHTAYSSDQMETVVITAHRPHTAAAQSAEKTLATAEKAINQYFVHHALSTQVYDLWLFPTNNRNSVFVQYELRGNTGQEARRQLALIELSGERVIRLVDLSTEPTTRLASAASGG